LIETIAGNKFAQEKNLSLTGFAQHKDALWKKCGMGLVDVTKVFLVNACKICY
jgi:hypothetical protein